MYFMYILYSLSRDRYYIGATQDTALRLTQHNSGRTKSTSSGKPWVLVHTESFDTRSEALKRETEIKNKKSRRYIEFLLQK